MPTSRSDKRRGRGVFTSNLTVNEFLLARQSGLQPISLVIGSSIQHVGWQDRRLPLSAYSGEVESVSQAMNHARQLAIGRLTEEAERVGAHTVVGVYLPDFESRILRRWAKLVADRTIESAQYLLELRRRKQWPISVL